MLSRCTTYTKNLGVSNFLEKIHIYKKINKNRNPVFLKNSKNLWVSRNKGNSLMLFICAKIQKNRLIFIWALLIQHIFQIYTDKSTFFSNLHWEIRFRISQKTKIAHNSLNNGRRAVLTPFLDIDIFWTFWGWDRFFSSNWPNLTKKTKIDKKMTKIGF